MLNVNTKSRAARFRWPEGCRSQRVRQRRPPWQGDSDGRCTQTQRTYGRSGPQSAMVRPVAMAWAIGEGSVPSRVKPTWTRADGVPGNPAAAAEASRLGVTTAAAARAILVISCSRKTSRSQLWLRYHRRVHDHGGHVGRELVLLGQSENHVVAGEHLGCDARLPPDDHRAPQRRVVALAWLRAKNGDLASCRAASDDVPRRLRCWFHRR